MLTIFAYLDPGAGSILLQAVVAGVLGGLFAIKLFWKRIVGFFHGGQRKEPDTKSTPESEE
jgi:hypothetical protein